jgi:hypothetical protein
MSTIAKRLAAAERLIQPSRRVHMIFGDTEPDYAQRDRMIAQGQALLDDKFVYILWGAPQQ